MKGDEFTPEPEKKWTRKNFDLQLLHGKDWRERAEIETTRDLSKDIEQLVCDFHDIAEIALAGKAPDPSDTNSLLIHAEKRMVSLFGKVALAHERSTKWLIFLTWVLVVMTAVLIWLTTVLVMQDSKRPNQSLEPTGHRRANSSMTSPTSTRQASPDPITGGSAPSR